MLDHATSTDLIREQRALIALSLIKGVGPGRIRSLVAHFGSAGEALNAPHHALARVEGVGPQTAKAIARFDDYGFVDEQMEQAEQIGAVLMPAWDPHFPKLLRQIYDPPAFLWVRGDLHPMDEHAVAIVGTRKATEYGKQMAYTFARELAQRGITIISGLAYGIDTAAHRGALEAGGRTLAVLGTGVDRVYPSSNVDLARRILEQGAVLSEFALRTKPDASNFPRRNRLISGLSLGTLVAEARSTGGAWITARLALEQNREVFAVPASLYSKVGEGCNRLIQAGLAKLVLSVEDILEEIQVGLPAPTDDQEPIPAPTPADLGPIEQKLWDALEAGPVQIDTLCMQTGLDTSTALVKLLSLEFKGLVRQMAGKQFMRA